MTRNRLFAAVLAGAFLMSATACGSDDDTTPAAAGNAPAATTAAPAATTPAAEPAAAAPSDKELCEIAKKSGEDLKKKMLEAFATGEEPKPAFYGEVYSGMADKLKTTGDSAVADAMNALSAEMAKAAAAKDPGEAGDNPAAQKALDKVGAACKTAGFPIDA